MEPVLTGAAPAALPACDHFETEVHGPVAVFRISRPGKLNALTAAFWPQLRTLLDAAVAHPDIRAIVLTGSGDRSFSTGGDIEAFAPGYPACASSISSFDRDPVSRPIASSRDHVYRFLASG